MSINAQRILLVVVLLVSLLIIMVFAGDMTATGPKFDHVQTRIDIEDDGTITIRKSDEAPTDDGTGTPAVSPIAEPPN